ncbi:MAG: tetratricopeptide repeat protein [Owenweeksia sp.]|nr:tetratricopeptide repeat protein [Owenweeksia sp.]
MARAHSMNGNHDKAILLQKESLRLAKVYGDPYLVNFAQAVMADIYLQAGQVDKALPVARKAYENREAQNRISAKKEAARVYARVLEAVDQPAKALQVMKQYLAYKDIIHSTSLSETLLQAQNDVIANSNQLLEEKAALQSEIINRNKILQYILIGSLLLAIIGITLIVINVRNKNKANRRLKYQRLLLNQKSRELAEVNNKLEKLNQGKDKLSPSLRMI